VLLSEFASFCSPQEVSYRLVRQMWPTGDVHRGQPSALAPTPRGNIGNASLLTEFVQAQNGPSVDFEWKCNAHDGSITMGFLL
jgi:hypothetical protein